MTTPLALLDDFGTHLAGLGLAPSTRQVRERVALRFARWCNARGVELADVETATIEECSPTTPPWRRARGPATSAACAICTSGSSLKATT